MRKHFATLLLALPLALGAIASAHGQIKLNPEFNPETKLTRPIETLDDFRSRFTIGVYEDPRLASPQRVREFIERLDLRTPLGRKVTDVVIHPDTGAFVGVDNGSIQFTGTLPDGSIIISTRDPGGQFTKADKDRLAWARPDGKPVCFDLVDVAQSDVKMSFTLLLDRSGSMANVMDEVLATTRHFLSLLPGNAQCSVVSFAGSWTNHTPGGSQQCNAVRISGIRSGGSTDIFSPLSAFYERYATPAYDGWQKAIIVITDGVVTRNADAAPRVKSQKGDVKTFVFWLGNREEKHLADIADHYLTQQGDVRSYLGEVYGFLGDAYRTQQVLKPRACTP